MGSDDGSLTTVKLIIELVQTAGVTGLLLLAIMAGLRGWVVAGYHYTECVRERERLLAIIERWRQVGGERGIARELVERREVDRYGT